jgi:5-methylcytosine-specific restriction enzyme A
MPTIPKGNPKRPWHQEHKGHDARRQRNDQIYNSRRWRHLRQLHLADHPLCTVCAVLGKTEPARVVDHIKPINRGGQPWDRNNLQSLCDHHHAQKSGRERHDTGGGVENF